MKRCTVFIYRVVSSEESDGSELSGVEGVSSLESGVDEVSCEGVSSGVVSSGEETSDEVSSGFSRSGVSGVCPEELFEFPPRVIPAQLLFIGV